MKKVLIIDDEATLRTLLSRIVGLEGFEVLQAEDLKSGMIKLEQNHIDVVLCDVKLPDGNGVDFTKTIKEKFPAIEVILLTAYGNIPDGVKAIKNGAFDYLTKGDDNNKIIPLLFRAFDKIELSSRVVQLEKQLGNKHSFENIIGKSKVILQAIELAKKVSQTDTTVLLTGETGVGKEVFAQSIHQASNRCKNNFVAINCSAFSKELLENELFGHKTGSFTGASKDQKGLLEEANKGTIFLDEIGEMHIELQAKILRVIENQEFIKIGDSKPTKIDVRIIAATNRDLEKEIENGNFREDLFYRISVFQIQIPALRNRKEDIEMLVNYFVKYFSIKANKKIESISQEALQLLKNHNWKGNIRELKNVIERSSILADTNIIDTDSLPIDIQNNTLSSSSNQLSAFDLSSAEKLHILKVLNYTKGNKTETAKLLNIALTTLYRKLADYSIQ
ncbi:MAG: sigma-54-dependent Fis family transcriptional regulator [Flavobacteriales bacterium]|nr:sigma-54-dependent Fis family transcriptional regulator [Flavobacteriales bacterium]